MSGRWILLEAAACLAFGMGLSSHSALAGPCSSQIAQLDKALSQSPALGPATTGTLSGSGLGAIKPALPATASTAGTTAGSGQLGGTGGTKEMNAASNQVATSAEDVRRQQAGQPTMAAAAAAGGSNGAETKPGSSAAPTSGDKMSQAKMDVEKARALDAKGDQACMDAITRARSLMQGK